MITKILLISKIKIASLTPQSTTFGTAAFRFGSVAVPKATRHQRITAANLKEREHAVAARRQRSLDLIPQPLATLQARRLVIPFLL